jgi:uncharacterized repeat protein (TIGR01451 family)
MPVRRVCTSWLVVAAVLSGLVGAALIGWPTARAAAATPATSLAADAFGVEARAGLLGAELPPLGPTPTVAVTMPPQRNAVTDELADSGQEPLVDRVRLLQVRADGNLAAGTATASAQAESLSLLGGVVTADSLRAVSTTTCAGAGTPEQASEGSEFVALSIGGQTLPTTPEPNTTVRLVEPLVGLVEVVVREAVPDEEDFGWTVRALRVTVLEPLTDVVMAEVIVAEAHASVRCADGGPPPDQGDRPPLRITKEASDDVVAHGEELTYTITVTNPGSETCTVSEVIDRLPAHFRYVSAGGILEGIAPTIEGQVVRFRNPAGWPVAAGGSLVGTITAQVTADATPGEHFNDAEARATCGISRTGPTGPVTVPTPEEVSRIDGAERIETTIGVAQAAWEQADAAVLARADRFPDALAAAPLAVEVGGPILVTPPNELRADVAAELRRLGVRTVYLVGGTAALSPAVADAVAAEGMTVRRLDGASRYDTAALVAEEIVRLGGRVTQTIVARADIFADSLAAGNLATWGRAPILLTDSTGPVHGRTAQVLTGVMQGRRIWIAGGNSALGPQVDAELQAAGWDPARLAGPDRYGTALAFIDEARRQGAGINPTLLASGLDFSDALVAAPAARKLEGIVMLTHRESLRFSPATREYFETNRDTVRSVLIVGGTAAVSALVEEEVTAILR